MCIRDSSEDFLKAVEIINSAKGKLIIVGIGKSAHVGNKIVATLNSTGTPSQFLHASEAIHGDLGVIQKTDVVLCKMCIIDSLNSFNWLKRFWSKPPPC